MATFTIGTDANSMTTEARDFDDAARQFDDCDARAFLERHAQIDSAWAWIRNEDTCELRGGYNEQQFADYMVKETTHADD